MRRVRQYLTYMRTSLSTKGQIVLPAELREQDALTPGQQFSIERVQPGQYVLRRILQPGSPGLLDWLRACPEKHWFQRVASESTDDL